MASHPDNAKKLAPIDLKYFLKNREEIERRWKEFVGG
jgi:hypothetical protein